MTGTEGSTSEKLACWSGVALHICDSTYCESQACKVLDNSHPGQLVYHVGSEKEVRLGVELRANGALVQRDLMVKVSLVDAEDAYEVLAEDGDTPPLLTARARKLPQPKPLVLEEGRGQFKLWFNKSSFPSKKQVAESELTETQRARKRRRMEAKPCLYRVRVSPVDDSVPVQPAASELFFVHLHNFSRVKKWVLKHYPGAERSTTFDLSTREAPMCSTPEASEGYVSLEDLEDLCCDDLLTSQTDAKGLHGSTVIGRAQ